MSKKNVTVDDPCARVPQAEADVASKGRGSLDERMGEVARSLALGSLDMEAGQFDARPNSLYSQHQTELGVLARKFYAIAPISDSAHGYGLTHPATAFARMYKEGKIRPLSEREQEACVGTLNSISLLWERQSSMPGMLLARNVLLYAVLNDPDLRHRAFAVAERYLDDCADALRRNGASLVG